MSEYWDQLMKESRTLPSTGGEGIRVSKRGKITIPLPRITTTPLGQQEKLTLGELLIRRIEMGESLEVAFRKALGTGIRQPGASKAGVTRYLLRELEKAQEEGRI